MKTNSVIKEVCQYLTFQIGNELFAFDVLKTNEVLEFSDITPIPGSMESMIGVINLRGKVVPVIDLRKKLKLQEKERTVDTCIIIIETEFNEEHVTLGVLVDAAKQVIMLDNSQLEPPPRVGMCINTEYITAIGKRDSTFIILLDSDRIFSENELAAAVSQQISDIGTDDPVS
ncbi:MAG: chemotaxis protein CheW [Fibrobacter sp.]|nr:chemotaxis protein CheW [Fibrobacter sp.]